MEQEKTFAKYDGLKQEIWSASSLNDFQLCARKYWYSKQRRLVPSDRLIKPTAQWGKSWHATTDVYDKALFEGFTREEALDAAIAFAWTQKNLLRHDDPDKSWDTTRTINTLLRSICWYSAKYADDPIKVSALPSGEPAIEIRFEVPIPGINKRGEGILDRIVHLDGSQYILDRKSTGQELSKWYFQGFAPDNQVMMYIWALREQLGLPVAGLIIDACQVLVSGTRFQRATFDISKSSMDEWVRDLKYNMDKADYCAENNHWPANFASCGMYGGCDFRRNCARSPEYREAYLEADFVSRGVVNEQMEKLH